MGHAAEDIAGGNLTVQLPHSPVYEIAEVSSALEGMSATLRESLTRQESLEGERKLFIGEAGGGQRDRTAFAYHVFLSPVPVAPACPCAALPRRLGW